MTAKTLVLGFGGTGTHILTYLKELAIYKYGSRPPHLAFIEFDTIARTLWRPGETVQIAGGASAKELIAVGQGEGISLDPNVEYLPLEEGTPSLRILVENDMSAKGDRNQYPHLKEWLHTDWLSRIVPPAALNVVNGAAQQRQIGRYAMFANIDRIVGQISRVLRDMSRAGPGTVVNVWVVGSAAGGTGAGCIIDAAVIVRMVAQELRLTPTLCGVIVLPDVYDDAHGVSRARAFSFFRELERFQELGIPAVDRIGTGTEPATASSEIIYDARGRHRALIASRLFDYLVYLGEPCRNNEQRISFFNSAANAIDSFLDKNIGPTMMEELVNQDGHPLCFGSARLSIPLNTYVELFAWEQVQEYLRTIGAPREDQNNAIVGVYSGASTDRQTDARQTVENMLKLFKELRDLADRERDRFPEYVEKNLEPHTIVKRWYGFGDIDYTKQGVSADHLTFTVPLTYCNPFLSLLDESDSPQGDDITVKTYLENRRSKNPIKESQTESRDRFVAALRAARADYTNEEGGEGTFERGRQLVRKALAGKLLEMVDEALLRKINSTTEIGVAAEHEALGTPFTRLYAELVELASLQGPLGKIEDVLAKCNDHLDKFKASLHQRVVDCIEALDSTRAPAISFSTWIDSPQRLAREDCMNYIMWHQKRHLIADMRDIVATVRQRYEVWAEVIQDALISTVLPRGTAVPALATVRSAHIHRLTDRLLRLAKDDRSLISLASREDQNRSGNYEIEMRGYAGQMRELATRQEGRSLATIEVARSRWTATISSNKRPVVALTIQSADIDLRRIHEILRDMLRPTIEKKLEAIDVFDYLLFEQNVRNLAPQDIVERLSRRASLLLSNTKSAASRWVYQEPSGQPKKNFADLLKLKLSDLTSVDIVQGSITGYSDRTALILLTAARLEHGTIKDVQDCRRAYEQMLTTELGNGQDPELLRALTYHPFRGEAEAWFIERLVARRDSRGFRSSESISPRIARLLDRPDLFQAFVHCLATGAIYQDEATFKWMWKTTKRERPVDLGQGDLIKAATVFVLQRREEGAANLFAITVDDAMASARKAANGGTTTTASDTVRLGYYQQIEAFTKDETLVPFLEASLPPGAGIVGNANLEAEHQRLRAGLRMAFQFYGKQQTKSDLSARTLY